MEDNISKLEKKILMQEKTSQQILGVFLIIVSVLNILEAVAKISIRLFISDTAFIGSVETVIAYIKLLFIAAIYFFCLIRMKKLYFHSPYVRKLLYIWGIILVPIQVIYEIGIELYNRMLGIVWIVLNQTYSVNNDAFYTMFYSSSHGFKYMGMFIGVVIGIIATGFILERRGLVVISFMMMVVFVASAFVINMSTLSLDVLSVNVGVNATAVIFHSLMTVGLFVLGFFIVRSYEDNPVAIEK